MTELTSKLSRHIEAYEAIGEEVPPYRCTLAEWESVYKVLQLSLKGASLLDISRYMDVEIELVVKIK